ncbi:unnamed protein product [Caenorhabditis auriculariae]|uniref:VWFA domain-containing protein n=1 Tax=Caenorhabditis auriculariae TaxID=2777116 RepID=A0A8S1H883_9PELO|nr:unnamed protein product [Caenorhabditis auriculariae]
MPIICLPLLLLILSQKCHAVKDIADAPLLRETYFSIGAHMNGDALSKSLQKNADKLLGISEFQSFLDSSVSDGYEKLTVDDRLADQVAERVDAKLTHLPGLLTSSFDADVTAAHFVRNVPPCSIFQKVLATTPSQSCYVQHTPNRELTYENNNIVLRRVDNSSIVQRQYVLVDGVQQLELPADFIAKNEFRHWQQFVIASTPFPKRIFIVFELGKMTPALLKTAKDAALHLLSMAAPDDHLHVVVAASGSVIAKCKGGAPEHRRRARRLIKTLRLPTNDSEISSHSAALNATFDLLRDEATLEVAANRQNVIYYISRGMFAELLEAKEILNSLAKRVIAMQRLQCKFKINTILIAEQNRAPLSWSYEFLENIAQQNFSIHKNSIENETLEQLASVDFSPSRGEMVVLSDEVMKQLNLRTLLKMNCVEGRCENHPSTVHWTYDIKASSMSVFRQFQHRNRSLVMGFDLHLDELFDEVLQPFAFRAAPSDVRLTISVVDFRGHVVASSSSRSDVRLNVADGWPKSINWLLNEFRNPINQRGTFTVGTKAHGLLSYYWRKMQEAPFVIVMSSTHGSLPVDVVRVAQAPKQMYTMENVLWHKNDDRQQKCLLHGTPVSQRFSSIFVPPSAYHPAAKRMLSSDALRNNWVYLFDNVGFIRSNSLRRGVREHLGILSNLSHIWQNLEKNLKDGSESPVIRRYAATVDGVLTTFPAQTIREDFEPTRQKWFVDAMNEPGKIVVTGPSENALLGDVITVSTTVLALSSSPNKQVFAVVAMDVPSGVFNTWLREGITACGQTRRCVLFAADGKVVYADPDPNRVKSTAEAFERYHISHLEPILAARMSRSPDVVKKRQCLDEGNELQRTSVWNTKYTRVFTVGCGEVSSAIGSPLHSETLLVPDTNIFLSMVNSSCTKPGLGTFCPCSVSDRRCLFCGRFDSNECECPCQCPFEETCADEDSLPTCVHEPTNSDMTFEEIDMTYKDCPNTLCGVIGSPLACRATPGCEWCAFSVSGATIDVPACSAISTCYQGVQGRTVGNGSSSKFDEIWPSKAPIGPLIACLFAVAVLVSTVAYCYRSQMTRLGERRVMFDASGMPLFGRHGPPFEFDLDGSGFRELKQPVQLASFERVAPIAERIGQAPTVSSDHGYSTMTDRNAADDSECAESVLTALTPTGPPDGSPRLKSCSLVTTSVVVHHVPEHVLREVVSSPMIETL